MPSYEISQSVRYVGPDSKCKNKPAKVLRVDGKGLYDIKFYDVNDEVMTTFYRTPVRLTMRGVHEKDIEEYSEAEVAEPVAQAGRSKSTASEIVAASVVSVVALAGIAAAIMETKSK